MHSHNAAPAGAQQAPRRALRIARVVAVCAALGASPALHAHGAQIETGGGAKGPVAMTDAQQKAIGLATAQADSRSMAEELPLSGDVRVAPGHQADVSPRISGQVTAIYASLGDRVRKGQRLARIQSRLVGDPPPSVDLVAPLGGVVDAMTAAIGQAVEPGTVLYRVSDRAQVDVVARLHEEDAGKVRAGQEVRIHALAYPGRTFTGKARLVGPVLDPQSRTFDLWIRLPNTDGALKPGMFVKAGVVLRKDDAALAVPRAAVLEANGESFVFVRDGGQFHRVDVQTGAADDQFIEIRDGLVPGDEVVTQGVRQVYTLWLTGGKPMKGEED